MLEMITTSALGWMTEGGRDRRGKNRQQRRGKLGNPHPVQP